MELFGRHRDVRGGCGGRLRRAGAGTQAAAGEKEERRQRAESPGKGKPETGGEKLSKEKPLKPVASKAFLVSRGLRLSGADGQSPQ